MFFLGTNINWTCSYYYYHPFCLLLLSLLFYSIPRLSVDAHCISFCAYMRGPITLEKYSKKHCDFLFINGVNFKTACMSVCFLFQCFVSNKVFYLLENFNLTLNWNISLWLSQKKAEQTDGPSLECHPTWAPHLLTEVVNLIADLSRTWAPQSHFPGELYLEIRKPEPHFIALLPFIRWPDN